MSVRSARIGSTVELAAVRRGVDQAEGDVRHRARLVGAQAPVRAAQLGGPEVDVRPLERAHLLAVGVGQGLPVAVLHDDQRLVVQGEVDLPVDERGDGRPAVGGLRDARAATLEQAPR